VVGGLSEKASGNLLPILPNGKFDVENIIAVKIVCVLTLFRMAAVDALHGHFKEIKQLFTKQVLNQKGLSGLYIDYAETSDKGLREASG
jgi:hypothetical protein